MQPYKLLKLLTDIRLSKIILQFYTVKIILRNISDVLIYDLRRLLQIAKSLEDKIIFIIIALCNTLKFSKNNIYIQSRSIPIRMSEA